MISVVFVCLGNICRSPLAEGAFRAAAEKAGLDVDVDSAGVGSWHIGEAPDPRAIGIAEANGVDISAQAARQITRHDYSRVDHIVALDTAVLNELEAQKPDASTAELSLFLDYVEGREGQDVGDPYYGDESGFAVTWADVELGAAALAGKLAKA